MIALDGPAVEFLLDNARSVVTENEPEECANHA